MNWFPNEPHPYSLRNIPIEVKVHQRPGSPSSRSPVIRVHVGGKGITVAPFSRQGSASPMISLMSPGYGAQSGFFDTDAQRDAKTAALTSPTTTAAVSGSAIRSTIGFQARSSSPASSPALTSGASNFTSSSGARSQLMQRSDSGSGTALRHVGSPLHEAVAEVDALTNLLVRSMSAEDHLGDCTVCRGKVVNSSSGLTVLGRVYHSRCFCCFKCKSMLRGKNSFVIDGRPACEDCYTQSLEKCTVCDQLIADRILRATGKPFHPQCFTCVSCGRSLDGVPFTVDATNQFHCIDDFHRKFAPRCGRCRQPITPEAGSEETVRIIAMDQNFHPQCYHCEDCNRDLSSRWEGGCFPLDGHLLCRGCNAKRMQGASRQVSVTS